MKKRMVRKPKDSEPDGFTQSVILLYLIENGVQDRTEISDFLKHNYHMVNSSNVKNHMYKLVKKGFVEPGDKLPGKPRPYKIKTGFDTIKGFFIFLKNNSLEKELMKSEYFKDYIGSDEFRIKFIANIFKANIQKIDSVIRDEEQYKKLIAKLNDTPGNERLTTILEKIKNNDIENDFVKEYQTIINDIQGNADELLHILESRFDKKSAFIEPLQFIKYMGFYAIPVAERDNIFKLLISSPSAMDFAFNPKHYDKYILWNLLGAYTGSTIIPEPRGFKETMETVWEKDKDSTAFFKILDFIYEDIDLYAILEESPITTILKAMMITDLIKGDIIKTEIPEKIRMDFSLTKELQTKAEHLPTNKNSFEANKEGDKQ